MQNKSLKPITKADLTNKISQELKLDKAEVKLMIESFYKVVLESISNKKKIELRGFGTFKAVKKAQKDARDIRRKKSVTIPAHYKPKFLPVETFVEEVKNNVK